MSPFTCSSSWELLSYYELGIIAPILQVGKLRLRRLTWPVSGHRASKWWSSELSMLHTIQRSHLVILGPPFIFLGHKAQTVKSQLLWDTWSLTLQGAVLFSCVLLVQRWQIGFIFRQLPSIDCSGQSIEVCEAHPDAAGKNITAAWHSPLWMPERGGAAHMPFPAHISRKA